MARWCKRWGMIVAGLLGAASQSAPALAQNGAMPPQGVFGAEPKLPQPPDFPNGVPGAGPDFPNQAKCDPNSPFSLDADFLPGAFDDDDRYCPPPPYLVVLRGEYLNWHVDRGRINVPLVTSSLTPNINNNFGALDQVGTRVVFGSSDFTYGNITGGRATLGLALGCFPPVEGTGFFLNTNRTLFAAQSNGSGGSKVLARPVLLTNFLGPDRLPGQQNVALIAFPGLVAGTVQVDSHLNLWGAETNVFCNLGKSDVLSVDFLLGYRYAELREGLSIATSSTVLTQRGLQFADRTTNPGEFVEVFDNFAARNQFNGGQFGFRSTLSCWRFNVMVDTKLALGMMREEARIDGASTLVHTALSTRSPDTINAGLLAVASNSGLRTKNDFAIVPELGVQLGYQITRNFRFFAGGTLLYISSVVRPGDFISTSVNSQLAPTLSQPAFPINAPFDPTLRTGPPELFLHSRDFWGYGYNIGLEFAF